MERNFRIHTNINVDNVLQVNMSQDFDFLEVLTMQLRQEDTYKLHSSNYGVIVGRVLANDAFGIPNAKVSVFIEKVDGMDTEIESLYPYSSVMSKNKSGKRYNLLPTEGEDDCYRAVGDFPSKRLLLDEKTYLEIYDEYWKYTTVTNQAGDYMIFAVPTGTHTVHIDVDLSDIGVLSQKPRDFMYKGYNETMFDSPNQFKESTNLDNLAQILSENKSVFVYPFWGDVDNDVIAITRCDIPVQYKFEPTCVFMGSIISDNDGNSIGHKCAPSVNNGMNNQLIAGEGTIEMIRKTTDGLVEEYQIQGNNLIDSDGVWCYQIPMNLDYVGTDEYGNTVPTDNPSKGIPTRTQVRFRFSKTETGDEGFSRHTAKYLVPMNPILQEGGDSNVQPKMKVDGKEFEKYYNFGSNTPQSCFRDLYWNNVYSVKNFIPKVQVARRPYSANFGALKGSNLTDDQNPVPFNKLKVDVPFTYMIICILFTIVMIIVTVVNTIIKAWDWMRDSLCLPKIPFIGRICPLKILPFISCISLSAGLAEGNTAFYPGCGCAGSAACKGSSCPDDMDGDCSKSSNNSQLMDKIQQSLAQDFDIVKLDFYQDWLNGSLYMPLWYWRKRKKKKFLFFTISGAKNEFCDCDKTYSRLKTRHTCNVVYNDDSMSMSDSNNPMKEEKWHKSRDGGFYYRNGLIKQVTNKDGLNVYYYVGAQPISDSTSKDVEITKRPQGFPFARLYATDIILLGNLQENNLYGIPQFFKCLPSTTANIPPIATVSESNDETETNNGNGSSLDSAEDSGTTITTGMDWGYGGGKESPTYKTGLFFDLACTEASTRLKSCINVERLSELGSNLDMTYSMSYADGGSSSIKRGTIESDGFVNKFELDDMNNRAMFATMNHVGFIPQDYQDSVSMYTTQVADENTGYLVPKFKYIYPVDFDGRMQSSMNWYGSNNGGQDLTDIRDDAYLTFRLGADKKGVASTNGSTRQRHFYLKEGNTLSMPLYNNSFYFYFGINKGKTAIDKFNKKFFATCTVNVKEPFSISTNTQGKSYCVSSYINKNDAYGYIRVDLEDIQAPYSYSLTNSLGTVVVSDDNMSVSSFVIGGTLDANGNVVSNTNGVVVSQTSGGTVDSSYANGLLNESYVLTVTDVNGKTMKSRVTLSIPSLAITTTATKLGTKYYSDTESPKTYICGEGYNGSIKFGNIYVDGYECSIESISSLTTNGNVLSFVASCKQVEYEGENNVLSGALVAISVEAIGESSITECLCDTTITDNTIKVYKPTSFLVKGVQMCDGQAVNENTSEQVVVIQNGENFNAFLNSMPVKFMIGDGSNMSSSNFYTTSTKAETSVSGKSIGGWFGVNDETAYLFKVANNSSQNVWEDFIDFNGLDIDNNLISKRRIIHYKLKSMFDLSDTTFMTNNSDQNFYYDTIGGQYPILFRNVIPYYSDDSRVLNTYIFDDSNVSTVNTLYPNIVGNNYKKVNSKTKFSFNPLYTDNTKLGNYFAAFTNNGGYESKSSTKPSASIKVLKSPDGASVTLGLTKKLGASLNGNIDTFKQVFGGGSNKPYLRAMYIDRRFDYDLVMFAPCPNVNFKIHENDEDDKVWKACRISGFTYNGIEMSYDENGQLISNTSFIPPRATGYTFSASTEEADCSGSTVTFGVTPSLSEEGSGDDVPYNDQSGSVEYSYKDETAETRLNLPIANVLGTPNSTVWMSSHNGYDEAIDKDCLLIKEFYSSTLYGLDIRNFYWSTFNKARLKKYCEGQAKLSEQVEDGYVFKYPSELKTYNGAFSWSGNPNTKEMNYPTVRYLDILKQTDSNYLSFETTSCSYSNAPILSEANGIIRADVAPGETTSVEFVLTSPITMLQGNVTTHNALYEYDKKDGEYASYKCSNVFMLFGFNSRSIDGFKVYPKYAPRLIQLLPYVEKAQGTDALTFLKTVTATGEIEGRKSSSINDTLNSIQKETFARSYFFLKKGQCSTVRSNGVEVRDDFKGNGDSNYDGSYFYKDGTYLTVDDSELTNNVKFMMDHYGVGDMKVFTILIESALVNYENDNLTKKIMLYETSDIYDVRTMKFKVNQESTKINTLASDGTYTHKLVLDVMMVTSGNPESMTCQTLLNEPSIMSKLENQDEDSLTVGEFSPQDNTITLEWESENEMGTNFVIEMYISDASGFTYKVKLSLSGSGTSSWSLKK